jgi:hypothetical protein
VRNWLPRGIAEAQESDSWKPRPTAWFRLPQST